MKLLYDNVEERASFRLALTIIFAHGMLSAPRVATGSLSVAEAQIVLDDAETLADAMLTRAEASVREQQARKEPRPGAPS